MKVKVVWGGITMDTFSHGQKDDKEAWKLEWTTDQCPHIIGLYYYVLNVYLERLAQFP